MIGLLTLMTIGALFFVPVMLFWMWTGAWVGLWAAFWSAWIAWPMLMVGMAMFGWLMLFGLPPAHVMPHFHLLPTLLIATLAIATGIWAARRYPRAIHFQGDRR